MIPDDAHERRERSGRSRPLLRLGLLALLVLAVFLLGIAFARTLDQRPKRGGVVTSVRTLAPVQQRPVTHTATVTVTSTAP